MFGFNFAAIRDEDIINGIHPARQVAGTGSSASTTSIDQNTSSSSSSTSPDTTTPSEATPSSSSAPGTSPSSFPATTTPTPTSLDSTSASSPASSTPPLSTSESSSRSSAITSSSSSNIVVIGSSTINRSTLSSRTVVSSALVASSTERLTYTSSFTSDGRIVAVTGTSDRVVSSTTGFAQATIEPALAGTGSDNGNGGLSASSKRIIGGVVGGVGGAIFLGAIALLVWRLWAKKKREQGLVGDPQRAYRDSAGQDSIMRSKSPMDRYRSPTPNASVNAASNF